jgi:ketosteroid isomerase-like protein
MPTRPERLRAMALGACAMVCAKAIFTRVVLFKTRRDFGALGRGDYEPALASFSENAVLHFNDGAHRWAGDHRGKAAIARFMRNYIAAGLQGEIRELHLAGAPWRMTLIARFDDNAHDSAGNELYRNRLVLLARTRWGRIVEHEDFYEDTGRIERLELRLRELGVAPLD